MILANAILSTLIMASPFQEHMENFDIPMFLKKAMGSTYESLDKGLKDEFIRVTQKRLKLRLKEGKWKIKNKWATSPKGLKAVLLHPKHSEVIVELIRSRKTGRFYDIRFDETSVLVAATGSLRKHMRKKTPQQILNKMKRTLEQDLNKT